MRLQSTTLTEQIKALASSMGFDVVATTRLSNLQEGESQLQEWIDEGRHGTMEYLEEFKSRRDDFFKKIPNAKSVIVLGVNYYSSVSSPRKRESSHGSPIKTFGDDKLSGRVARYAWGKDYHNVIRQKHEALITKLQDELKVSFKALSCVDTKPLLERAVAVKAGLGFVGKNTMLLSKKFGPWLFLSEIVTDLELDEDEEGGGDCGTCVKCQEVCPTGALDEDYRIDARLCIAYLTIEHKGVIPRELRSKIKDWIFGCDECLAICPFTSHQKDSKWKELLPEAGVGPSLSFDDLFQLESNRLYQDEFKESAMLRANRKQMMRNACIVLGNSGSEEAIPYLEKAFKDKSPLVRQHAAWALGELDFPRSRKLLLVGLEHEKDVEVLEEIRFSLK